MSILVVYSYEDGAGTKTQGSTAAKSSFLLKTVEFVTATIGTKFRVTDESLDDLPEIMQEIAIVAPSKIKDNIDSQILGSAGDDTSTIKGLYAASKHTDFAGATTYAATIPNANKVDVISLMKDQIETNKYIGTDLSVNPLDLRKIAAEKDQLDNSKIDRRVTFDALGEPLAICGLMIRRNTNQTINTLSVLAKEMLQIGDRKQMTLEVGYDGNDFTEGWKTVRINVRLAFAVRDAAGVIYCDDLATAVTNISTI
jgi:HK97 family phage major capsid protein